MLIDTQGVDRLDELDSSFSEPKPGKYHCVVNDCDDSMAKFEAVMVDVEVLAGTVPGQEGRTKRLFFNIDNERAQERLKRFAMATGLIGPNEAREVQFRDAVGRQLILEFSEYVPTQGKNAGKPQLGLAFGGIWSLDHPDVKDVPRASVQPNASAPAPQSEPQPAGLSTQTGATAAPAATDDKWDI